MLRQIRRSEHSLLPKAKFPYPGRICFNLQVLFWALLILLSVLIASTSVKAAQLTHDDAVSLARSGRYSEALTILEPLHNKQPNNDRLTYDLIVIYNWAGKYQQTCSLFENQEPETYPFYVQSAALNAYRRLNQLDQALALVNILLTKQPYSSDLLRYKALLYIDKHQLDSARTILDTMYQQSGKDVEYYRLSGRLHTVEGNWLGALSDYQQVSRLAPDDKESLQEQFSALQHIRAPEAANIFMLDHKQLLRKHDRAHLGMNQAARNLRWSTDASNDYKEASIFALQALAEQLQAMDSPGKKQTAAHWSTPILRDIIVSLRNMRRMGDVETIYQHLSKEEEQPSYVMQAAADAMLANRHPDKSGELFRKILNKEPGNYYAQIGLFYSLIEEEKFGEAYKLIDSLYKNEPVSQVSGDPNYRPVNDRYLDLGVYTIMARYYGDQLEDAWSRADKLVQNAPANSWLYEVRGQISNSRQWYQQGLYDFHYSSLLAPNSLNAKAGKVSTLIALKRYGQARPLLKSLKQQFPDEDPIRALEKEWELSRKPVTWADVTLSHSSGPENDGDGLLGSAELLSSPITDHLYIDGLYRYAWNEIIEGEETFERYSLGLDYVLKDLNFVGRATYNDSTLDEIGGSLKATWTPDDFWSLTLSGERFSVDTPLRALYHKIRSDAFMATINYRWSEQHELSLSAQGSNFTDGNNRIAGNAILRQRLIDVPHFDLDGRIEMYSSANSLKNGPYFNPENDFSLSGALHLDHVYYHRYDSLLAQQIDAGYGFYNQKGYEANWIGHIRYEHRYKPLPWLEIQGGMEFGRNVYDGQAEYYRLFRLMINWKF